MILRTSLPVSGVGFMTRRHFPSQVLSLQDSQQSLIPSLCHGWLLPSHELYSLLCNFVETGWHFTKCWIFYVSHQIYLKGFISNTEFVYSCQDFICLDVPGKHPCRLYLNATLKPVDPTLKPVDLNHPDQNTGVGNLSLLEGIFPIQGSNPGLPHWRLILYQLSHQGSPKACRHLPVFIWVSVYLVKWKC